MTYRTPLITLVLALVLFAGAVPVSAQERCTSSPGRDNSCSAYSTCNSATGKCDRNQNVPVGGACIEDGQCTSGQCFDLECKPANYVPSATGSEDEEGRLANLLQFDSVEELLVGILDLMVQVGSILLVFALVLAGFRFVSAQGSPEKISKARDALTWVVVGGLLLLGAQAFSLVIKATVETL